MSLNNYDDLDICQMGLDEIAGPTINSIDDPTTDVEATCARLYPLVVGDLLASHDWNFASPVRQLAVNADETPVGGYDHAYRLPSDLIAGPFAVYGDGDQSRPISSYENANDHIHTNFDIVHVKYRNVPAVSTWPIYFVNLVVMALAARLAKPVADNTALGAEKNEVAFGPPNLDGNGGLFAKAKRIDAISEPTKTIFKNGNPLSRTRR